MTIETRGLAQKGEFFLEEAILGVLLVAEHNKECLGPAEIRKRAGIYRLSRVRSRTDAISHSILYKLQSKGLVKKVKKGWELKSEGIQSHHTESISCDSSSSVKLKIKIETRRFAQKGEFFLEEAVLNVLQEAEYSKECLGPAEIRRRAGIYRLKASSLPESSLADAILNKLLDKGLVKNECRQSKGANLGWELA